MGFGRAADTKPYNQELYLAAGKTDLCTRLRLRRLAFMPRLVDKGSPLLHRYLDTLLHMGCGWAQEAHNDYEWACALL
eukprot:7262299-Prorocentrum_lima.AAC.1